METVPQQIDLTRLSRHERRQIGKLNGIKIPGRNMGFQKKLHGTIENFYKLREEEIVKETKELNDRDKS